MNTTKDHYLLVVSVNEGRNFPKRLEALLIVDARLDGETLSTDEIPYSETPIFDTDLAWEVDRKALRLFRIQRIPVKLQCFAINKKTSTRELIGYVVLDLRLANAKTQVSKWYSLLSPKYNWIKPEISLRLSLEKDKNRFTLTKPQTSPTKLPKDADETRNPPPTFSASPEQQSTTTVAASELRPRLNDSEGYYEIGQQDGASVVSLSATVVFASNLAALTPDIPVVDKEGYFIYYSLLGNDVVTDRFSDLIFPNFSAERATVRIKSCLPVLHEFFRLQPGLQIHLCLGDISLGCADVPLSGLVSSNSTEIFMKPISIEGTFELKPLTQSEVRTDLGSIPVVGVSVNLRLEDDEHSSHPIVLNDDTSPPTITHTSKSPPRTPSPTREAKNDLPNFSQSPPVRLKPPTETENKTKIPLRNMLNQTSASGTGVDKEKRRSTSPPLPSVETVRMSGSNSDMNGASLSDHGVQPENEETITISDDSVFNDSGSTGHESTTSIPPAPQRPRVEHSPKKPVDTMASGDHDTVNRNSNFHQYSFTLDLRTIKLTKSGNTLSCYLRYSYPFFGTSEAILTYPPIEVQQNVQAMLPHGFCSFSFAAVPDQVKHAFNSIPLYIELVHRDRSRSENRIVGMAVVHLSNVLESRQSRVSNAFRQTTSKKVVIQALDEEDLKHIGEVNVVMSLDDFGRMTLPSELLPRVHNNQFTSCEGEDYHDKHYTADRPSPRRFNPHPNYPAHLPNLHHHLQREIQNEDCRFHAGMDLPIPHSYNPHNPPPHNPRTGLMSGDFEHPATGFSPDEPVLNDLQRQMAYEVALELEQWKAMQEDIFKKEMKEKESQYLGALVNEWKKRDTEREVVLQRKLTECREMEDKLRKALVDIEKRERILASKETELVQSKAEFERERESQQKEVTTGFKRLKEDLENRLELEKLKTAEILKQKDKMEKEVREIQRKLEAKTEEFAIYREEQRNNPELRLESDMHLLSLEKSELERKLDAVTKSKVHYKQQWGRCLRELARIKQKLESDARAQLYKQQQELETMRIQYMESEGKDSRMALQEIQGDINLIKEKIVTKSQQQQGGGSENLKPRSARQISFLDTTVDDLDSDTDYTIENDNITRLQKERETLLQTGVYTETDRIIQALDRQIKEASMTGAE